MSFIKGGMMYGKEVILTMSAQCNCIYYCDTHCRLTGGKKHCTMNCVGRLRREDAVSELAMNPKLLHLIKQSNGEMLFVENDNMDYTDEDLNDMMYEVLVRHPSLDKMVDIDATRTGDYLICIYEGANSLLYNPMDMK